MAFLKFTRDKRGYEHFHLFQPANRRGKAHPRLLYCYRTPPNVRVGREPFDEAMRRALEAQNPDVSFDWKQIIATPIPSADAELWRERRRAERAARHAAHEDEAAEAAEAAEVPEVAAREVRLPDGGAAPAAAAPSGAAPRRRHRRRRGGRGDPVPSGAPGSPSTSREPQGGAPEPSKPLDPPG